MNNCYGMDQATLITIHFLKDHKRCFDYTSDPLIVSELLSIVQDSNVSELFEEKLSLIHSKESFSELFRCHLSKKELDNELEGPGDKRVYTTWKYYDEREEGYVSKTYGPGAYYLEGLSEYVVERKPYCFKILFDSNVKYTTVVLSESMYNKYHCELYFDIQSRLSSVSIRMVFAYWLKHIKGVDVLKITDSNYSYPIVIFL